MNSHDYNNQIYNPIESFLNSLIVSVTNIMFSYNAFTDFLKLFILCALKL